MRSSSRDEPANDFPVNDDSRGLVRSHRRLHHFTERTVRTIKFMQNHALSLPMKCTMDLGTEFFEFSASWPLPWGNMFHWTVHRHYYGRVFIIWKLAAHFPKLSLLIKLRLPDGFRIPAWEKIKFNWNNRFGKLKKINKAWKFEISSSIKRDLPDKSI